ncbi:MAG: polyphosphate kinase 1 [Spirochaetales bacterium]|nr:polyphosphate kinase 1 [Spirochaetales bacterium]
MIVNKKIHTFLVPKEISWLSFNDRVLQEAANPEVPLIERIKFLSIFSSNLDDFFKIRVATLKRLAKLGKKAFRLIGHDPREILEKIHSFVLTQQEEFNTIYAHILQELAERNIHILNEKELTKNQGIFVKEYFKKIVRPKLIPIMIDQVDRFPDLKEKSIYLAVRLSNKDSSEQAKYALIEVPTGIISRFLILPPHGGNQYIILLDDVIRYGLNEIFALFHYNTVEAYTIKLTRDAELDIEDDVSQSMIKKVAKSLRQRKEGNPVRFIYDETIPEDLLNFLIKQLDLTRADARIPGSRYHNFKDFMNFPDFNIHELKYEPFHFLPQKDTARNNILIKTIRTRDILLHYPYQSFHYVIDLLREASIDPKVLSIKITLYRVAKQSSVINALINAVKNGKQVMVVLELQARFDEEANVKWANELQSEGVKVLYGVPGLKVHSKLCLITRNEKGRFAYYAIIGTGNFNEDTASSYSDHSLFTVDKRLTKEVINIFDFFEHNYKISSFKHLLVAPFTMRKKIIKLISTETENAEKGEEAYIILKLNNLVDSKIIIALYKASQAGVKIKLIVRGMFALMPGIPGVSQNIQAISIVDRFLEHSRIFVFCNGGNEKYYISSADLMRRNLDRRVEVACPIYDKSIQYEIQTFLDIQWADNIKARVIDPDFNNLIRDNNSDKKIRAQWEIYEYLKSKVEHIKED